MQITISKGRKAKNPVSLQILEFRKAFLPTSLFLFFTNPFLYIKIEIQIYFWLPRRASLPLCISLFPSSLPFHVLTPLPFVYLCPFQGSSFLPPSPPLSNPIAPSLLHLHLSSCLFSSLSS